MRAETVLGAIAPEKLGAVDYHDHLVTIGGGEVRLDKDLALERTDHAIRELAQFHQDGINTLVDMNPIDCGRGVEELIEIAKAVPVNIIACTGFQRSIYYDRSHWIYRYSVEQIADLIEQEIVQGIDANNYNGPLIRRLPCKAGVIKCATEYNYIPAVEEKLIKAAAMAHKRTGAPISTHTERGTMALETLDILERNGADPSKVILGHIDRNPDFRLHSAIAKRGANLGYDGPSRTKYWPDNVISDLMRRMVEAGYQKHMFLGGDMGRASYWKAYGGGPGLSYMLTKFAPRLREDGIPETALQDILINNPRRVFVF